MKGVLYIRDKTGKFVPIPAIKGAKGDKGDAGESAYTVAKANGYEGTEAEFNNALAQLVATEGFASDAWFFIKEHEADTENPHKATAEQVGAAPSEHNHDDRYYTEAEMDTKLASKAASSHTQAASTITAGTFSATGVKAKSGTDYSTARVRNISAGTEDLEAGVSALESGSLYFVYE